VYAAEPIPEGKLIWKFQPGFDLALSFDLCASLSEAAQEYMYHHSEFDWTHKAFILCSDNARFMNHSDTPNCLNVDSQDGYGITIAGREISEGEELTCDYHSCEACVCDCTDFSYVPRTWLEGLAEEVRDSLLCARRARWLDARRGRKVLQRRRDWALRVRGHRSAHERGAEAEA
jgi:hypothetical protein